MKKFFLILGVFAAMLSTMVSCQEDTAPSDQLTNETKGAAVKNALKVMSNTQALERLGFGASSMLSNQVGISSARTQSGARTLTTARTAGDSTEVDDHSDCEWTTCATETFEENGDGSYTWTLDYGEEGCEEYDYFMKGKLIETYVEDGNSFSGTIEYVEFGDEYSTQNGTLTYSGTWDESGNDDSTEWTYSGTYEHSENLTYTYVDEEIEETYSIVSSGKESYDQNGFTVDQQDYTYTASNGDSFSGRVISPLFYSYSCESDDSEEWIFVYVSGEEQYEYNEADGIGEFNINYGNGDCDNIITITENGETYDIDLGEEWEDDWEDEDEEGEDDTTNS